MGDNVVTASHLSQSVGGNIVLKDISLRLDRSAGLAILGSNGAGKTTLLRVVAGLWTPTTGKLWRFGLLVGHEASSDPRIGYLGHQSFLYPGLTVTENLRFYARLWRVSHPDDRIAALLRRVGLGWSREDPVRTFSRGMLQRAAIARLLLTEPALMLLDEPYTGLDLGAQSMLDDILKGFVVGGGSFLLISHHAGEALRVADAVAILERGRLVWWSPTSQVNGSGLEATYRTWASGQGGHA